jgi:hypothetical protein
MRACRSTNRKPVIPNAFLELSQPSDTLTPRLFKGPRLKLKVSNIKAASDMPLFIIKKGKSFQGTVPTI